MRSSDACAPTPLDRASSSCHPSSFLAQGQSDLPQFRAGVELIQLDVAVLDDKRQPVRGLTASDFTVLDNGVATPIRAFTPVELAAAHASTEAVWAEEVPPMSPRIKSASRTAAWSSS